MMETKQQLKALTDFLLQYKWIYDFKLTNFFIDRVWEQIPEEWVPCINQVSVEEINQIPFGYMKDDWPVSLQKFLHDSLSLSVHCKKEEVTEEVKLDQELRKGMNPKKQHEVSHMAALVHDLACQTGSDVIVDIGSGLGYLGQALSKVYGHTVVGIESKQCHTTSAEKRTLPSGKMINMTFELQNNEESMESFKQTLSNTLNKLNASTSTDISKITKEEITLNDQPSPERETVENCKAEWKEKDRHEILCQCKNGITCSNNILSAKNATFNTKSTEKLKCDNCHEFDSMDDVLQKDSISNLNNCGKIETNICNCNCNLCNLSNRTSSQSCHGGKSKTIEKSNIFKSASIDSCYGNTSVNQNVLMIGLHCCGDLTPTMMRYFSEVDFISGLCCVSCCYHRMIFDESNQRFNNFPLSETLKSVIDATQLNLFAMRLAAQETKSRWGTQTSEDHDYHMKNVAYRGILELYCRQESCDHQKLFRKLTRRSDMSCFVTYVNAVLKRTDLQTNGDEIHQKLMDLHTQYEKYFDFIEPFTMLQVMMQPVIETLIYLDRQQWLRENGHHTYISPVFNDNISPRNLALIAYKTG